MLGRINFGRLSLRSCICYIFRRAQCLKSSKPKYIHSRTKILSSYVIFYCRFRSTSIYMGKNRNRKDVIKLHFLCYQLANQASVISSFYCVNSRSDFTIALSSSWCFLNTSFCLGKLENSTRDNLEYFIQVWWPRMCKIELNIPLPFSCQI